MNLVVDIGNSRTKLYIFNENEIVNKTVCDAVSPELMLELLKKKDIGTVLFSSVARDVDDILDLVIAQGKKGIVFDHNTPIPIQNLYKTPQTLGLDRLAAAVGANELFPNQNIVIIDAGTAITIDFITTENQFIGGNISPGLNTRYKALHNYTNKLPLLELKSEWSVLGSNTETAITSGVQQGIVFELLGYINWFNQQYNNVKTIITGGDAQLLAKKMQQSIIVEPDLVLKGLNRIIQYNANKK